MSAPNTNSFDLATQLGQVLTEKSWTVTTAESCTGGLVAASITDVAGSSAWFRAGIVSYANSAKIDLLEVDHELLAEHGAVSEAVVRAMAVGAKRCASADIAVAISGVAGPEGGTPTKPVGTVWIAWAFGQSEVQATQHLFTGDRLSVRSSALNAALRGTIQRVKTVCLPRS